MYSIQIPPPPTPRNMQKKSDLDFNLSRSSMVELDSVSGLPIYHFLSVWNTTCNIWPNLATLQDIRLQNLTDLDFDLSSSLKVISYGAIGLPIYGFLLMFNSNT